MASLTVRHSFGGVSSHIHATPKRPVDEIVSLAHGARRSVARLAEVLKPPVSPDTCKEALRLLAGVASSQETKQVVIKNDGLAEDIIALLKHEDAVIRELSVNVISRLLTLLQGWSTIHQGGGLPVLCELLCNDDSSSVRAQAASALYHMSLSCEGCDTLTNRCPGAVSALVGGVSDEDISVRLASVMALGNLLRLADANIQAVKAGMVASLVEVIVGPNRTEQLRAEAVRCLFKAVQTTEGKAAAINAGAMKLMGALLADSNSDLRRLAAGCVNGITTNENGKRAVSELILNRLVDLLEDESTDTQYNAMRAIRNICEHGEARQRIRIIVENRPQGKKLLQQHSLLRTVVNTDDAYFSFV
mmetsp:Transcript_48323/g.80320  ORF Transcript_48323/g.80320 Transcript_48323/m.80320 type:complete len:361 (-) Transcript_48323:301-1383(-)|eukprot:CAMPEP_0184336442 /NCGR_PEP_ID=MMETSP1089-20130417/4735_1 /TAXON_ID=38269 ORGANISM="Gloeochaete wittrockiana, Strain SAG46.84" /NCGR_SAMPLE_ID=MMETSP1089 /ASSEMBLY_ACC=CAM_ASM_000445 /LENGTH=360 /DNA_ID=CAMNT_0026661459 /DNA_START=46 /DNA_END=1128 /DNA_ORIENTATION=-